MKTKTQKAIIAGLILFFVAGLITIFNTVNSFGGADNIAHYFGARYGWEYPELLFNHWNKPVFTILASPFAQAGFDGVRVFNLLLGLLSAFLTYKTAETLKIKNSVFVVALTLFTPLYFILMFTGLTEISFSFFLILSIYLFFKDRFLLSAIVLSFLPMIRNEGIIFFPLFALAYGLKKSYLSIPALASGFLLISILGLPFHKDFFWLISEMPYGDSSSIYGSGPWWHFIANSRVTTGWPVFVFFLWGFGLSLVRYFKKGFLHFDQNFYILLLVFLPFSGFVAAHSLVWYLGTGGSLGLLRVVGSVIPLAAIGSLYGFNNLMEVVNLKSERVVAALMILVSAFMFFSSYKINKWAFHPSEREKLIAEAATFLKENKLTDKHLVYYDVNLIYDLNIDPYGDNVSWMISDKETPSLQFPPGTVIVWDAHFGNNEGRMPLKNLENDPYLKLINEIKPQTPFKTLGGYDYKICIFQKKERTGSGFLRNFLLDFNDREKTENEDSLCFPVNSSVVYSPGVSVNTAYVCDSLTKFDIDFSVDIKAEKDLKNLIAVLSIDGKHHVYKSFAVKYSGDNRRHTTKHTFRDILISPDNLVLKVYLWNKGRNTFLMDNFRVSLKKAEP